MLRNWQRPGAGSGGDNRKKGGRGGGGWKIKGC